MTAEVIDRVRNQLFIGGAWIDATSAATFAVQDPATDAELARVADASAADAIAALDAAVAVQSQWARSAPRERSEILRRAFELVIERAEELATVMTLEMGKPLSDSRSEVAYGAEFLRWFAEEAVRISGRYGLAPNGDTRLLTMRQAVGPCFMITPWNFPLAMATRKIAPAVAAGCTLVIKPAELTPLTTLWFAELMAEAGLPDGVLNVVTSSDPGGVSAPIIADPRLRKLTFTGSTRVGRELVGQSAAGLLRVSMELGGNAPFIVFADADLDAAIEGAMVAKLRNGGQACTSANRFLIHADIAPEFTARLSERMGALTLGSGMVEGVDIGPLIDRKQRDSVAELVDDAIDQGGRALIGGQVPAGPGWFYPPTVLVDVPVGARVWREEIFGPVAPIFTFEDETEALRLANETEYGLVGYAYTADYARAIRVYEGLQTGMVGINQGVVSNPAAPFGGVKDSGFGREGGSEGIDEYLTTKYVGLALS